MTDWSRRPQVPEPERDPQRQAGGEPARPDVPRDLSNAASVPNETKVTSAANEQDQRRGGEPKVTAATTKSSTERSSARDGDGNGSHRAPKGGSNLGAVLAALVLGLLLGAFAMSLLSSDDEGGGDTFAGVIDADRYQAVILSNDKVYFGRIEDVSDDFFQLDNAFFLRETRASEDAEPDRSLLPVNREIHAPDNTMLIRKDEVVLVENLAEDSPILTEINRQLGDE
jgi:hypothetical protein